MTSHRVQLGCLRLVKREPHGPAALVFEGGSGLGLEPCDEAIVGLEAALEQTAQRWRVTFDGGREDAGRRLRGHAADSTRIQHQHRRAAQRELVRDRAADDAGADDGDVHEKSVLSRRESHVASGVRRTSQSA